MRSAAAQHIRLENVCGFHSVRYSQMPASGDAGQRDGLSRQPLDQSKRRRRSLRAHALVEEDRRQRQHHLAVDVVLGVQRRAVADAHRPFAVVARPVFEDRFLEV